MGFCRKSFSLEGERVAGVLLVPGGKEIQLLGPPLNPETATVINPESEPLSLLITASAVRALGPEEATLPRMPAGCEPRGASGLRWL